jgi:hypothetical protein
VSIFRSFNESVFRGPEAEGGSGDVEVDTDVASAADDSGADTDSGDDTGEPERTEPLSVREELKRAIAETSEPSDPAKVRDPKTGRFNKGKEAAAPAEAPKAEAAAPATPAVEMPNSLAKELKPVWEATPPEMQAAFLKRETDIAKGVEELKQRYTLIDQAIAPHTDALRQMNATPGDAVNRMFLWFKALAGRPAEAFPELAKSMGIDWQKLAAAQNGAAPVGADGAPPAEGVAPDIPEPVKQYVSGMQNELAELRNIVQQIGGRFGNVEQNLNTQNEARTRENLSIWSTGKPHFEDVRQDMAKLIETGVIPLKADGQVDLDTAYERAIYFNPDVRAKVIAEQQQADLAAQQKSKEAATAAQQTNVNRARKAAASLPVTTPGEIKGNAVKKKPGERMSVRESLNAAMAELKDQ